MRGVPLGLRWAHSCVFRMDSLTVKDLLHFEQTMDTGFSLNSELTILTVGKINEEQMDSKELLAS